MKSQFKNLLLLTTVLSTVFLFSCGDEDPEDEVIGAPSLSVTASESTYTSDDTITFDVTYDVPGEFGGFNYSWTATEGGTVVTFDKQFFTATQVGEDETATSGTFTFNPFNDKKISELDLTVNGAAYSLEGKSLSFTFELANKKDTQTATKDVDVDVEVGVEEFQAVLIGGQANVTYGSFYDATGNAVYKIANGAAAANSASIDLVYYYLNTETNPETAIMAAPDNNEVQITFGETWPLTTENSTRFKSSDAVFADITTSTQVAAAYSEVGDDLDRVVGLEVGQVVAFQVDESKGSLYGAFEVVSIDGSFGSERTITINVKVQK